jgi:membrane associated rhomboid family serine protease
MAYQYGAFWAGLLYGWRPNYASQPVMMFASYGWLHAGPGHLLGNLGALLWLGPDILQRLGRRGFITLWAISLLGGAGGFALLTSSPAPMVGASGALFGLAGAWLVDEMHRIRSRREKLWRGVLGLVALLAINAVAWALQGGQLAWETHLGGLAAGLAFAALWQRPGRKANGRPATNQDT